MKSQILALYILFLSVSAFAKIHEVKRISEATSLFLESDLVVFDLDDTIITSQMSLGSDRWFEFEVEQLMSQGVAQKDAVAQAQHLNNMVVNFSSHQLVEQDMQTLIHDLQKRGRMVIALTARRTPQINEALRALKNLKIDLTKTAPKAQQLPKNFIYLEGVLFASGRDKGQLLLNFLKAQNLRPQTITFVDNKLANVESVAAMSAEVSVLIHSIHYRATEDILPPYRHDIARFQLRYLLAGRNIPTDQEALTILPIADQCDAIFSH